MILNDRKNFFSNDTNSNTAATIQPKEIQSSRQLSQFWTADILLKYPTFEGVFSHFHGQNRKCIVFRLKCGSMELFYSLLD